MMEEGTVSQPVFMYHGQNTTWMVVPSPEVDRIGFGLVRRTCRSRPSPNNHVFCVLGTNGTFNNVGWLERSEFRVDLFRKTLDPERGTIPLLRQPNPHGLPFSSPGLGPPGRTEDTRPRPPTPTPKWSPPRGSGPRPNPTDPFRSATRPKRAHGGIDTLRPLWGRGDLRPSDTSPPPCRRPPTSQGPALLFRRPLAPGPEPRVRDKHPRVARDGGDGHQDQRYCWDLTRTGDSESTRLKGRTYGKTQKSKPSRSRGGTTRDAPVGRVEGPL